MKSTQHGKPSHIARPSPEAGKKRKRRPPSAPVREYRPGYFTEPVRGNSGSTWPPQWEPSVEGLRTKADDDRDAARVKCVQRRSGFHAAAHTLGQLSTTPKRGRPRKHEGGY